MVTKVLDIETNGLSALESRITCISLSLLESENIHSFSGEDEKLIIETFWNAIDNGDTIITFNGNCFDFPFIIQRSIILGIKVKKFISIDIRNALSCFTFNYDIKARGSLNTWSKLLGFGEKQENGEKVIEYYNNKDWENIKRHCVDDVKITKGIFLKLQELNVL